ncbi:hypothetical protein M9H77_35294 [Catharanthus roseus]|uniref:Uncharacterized protein n=1 Tax=Catharanthus roseus TaxID=4058 RepID=A0ACB9ZQB5_CATRO|nr:hypothetical protein M9H77_35294 [Catharanthus roseus]
MGEKAPYAGGGPVSTVIGRLMLCKLGNSHTYHRREGGDPWEGVDSKLHSKWIYIKMVSEQPPIEGQLELHPTVDSSPAPTVVNRLLSSKARKFSYLLLTVGSLTIDGRVRLKGYLMRSN